MAVMATEQGRVYETRVKTVTTRENEENVTRTVLETRELLNQPLESADRDRPGTACDHEYQLVQRSSLIGTLSRGLMEVRDGAARPVQTRPMVFFVNALERNKRENSGSVRESKEEPGALTGDTSAGLKRTETPTGPVCR